MTGAGRRERKVVSVLFADLVGFTAKAETLEIFRDMGARPHEAESYVLAAREGMETELGEAIDLFREVGASRFLAEAQSLAAQTRSA